MGYTTDFDGSFELNKPLSEKMKDFITKFSGTRRMARKQSKEFGVEGEFFIEGTGNSGQGTMPDVIDHNKPPRTQPGLWCQWVPNEDGTEIVWDGGGKFYYYTEWLVYLIHKILAPNGYVLNGQVTWQGEETGDVGEIYIENNKVFTEPYKGTKKEITPENCEAYAYPQSKSNFMQTDVVFLIDKKTTEKKTAAKKVSKPKPITIKIDGLKENLDDKQLRTLMNVVRQYTEGLVDKKERAYSVKQGKNITELKG
jgi:hypothetical protein